MKKALSVLLVLVMVFTASFAIAEEINTVAELMQSNLDFAKARLESLIDFYLKNHDYFDAEYAEMTYRYFILCRTLSEIVSIESNYELKQNEFSLGKGIREQAIFNESLVKTDEMLEQIYDSYWYSFRKQEITTDEFMKLIVNQVNVTSSP